MICVLSLYYRGRRRRMGTAVSGSGLPVRLVPPAGLNTALLLIWVQDRRSSCSGTPTQSHRSLNRASSRPTRTSLRPLTHTQPHVTIYPFRGVWDYYGLRWQTWTRTFTAGEFPSLTGAGIWSNTYESHDLNECKVWSVVSHQLLQPSGDRTVSPGRTRRPVCRSRQGHSSLSTHSDPSEFRTLPSVQ